MKTLRLVIHGRVQGVFFRNSMRHEAQNLAITGWVRNSSEDTVETVVQSEPAAVDTIARWSQRSPRQARVERIEIEPVQGSYSSFEVIG